MLTALWWMITDDHEYIDPGGDYFARRDPDRAKNRALQQLHAIGYDVTLTPRVPE